ncbi:hypothetical protein [Flagellimonas sp. S3867]|uniref:hypothetical protein n=1 Tax=Flagellimonas sp. S3867 TaxID=2768063 RepID=UPI0016851B9B|nr:hypothetical protein [Flagellimonas sp. S3867]
MKKNIILFIVLVGLVVFGFVFGDRLISIYYGDTIYSTTFLNVLIYGVILLLPVVFLAFLLKRRANKK